VLGGPSVSGCAEYYPSVDVPQIEELGDATDGLSECLDKDVDRPHKQLCFTTIERLPLEDFPAPAYELVDLHGYFLGSIQLSRAAPTNASSAMS
jgi:hypothetical protein